MDSQAGQRSGTVSPAVDLRAPGACCGEGLRSSLSRLLLFPQLLLPGALQIDPRDPVAEAPCSQDHFPQPLLSNLKARNA
jgi:hypothetical protein